MKKSHCFHLGLSTIFLNIVSLYAFNLWILMWPTEQKLQGVTVLLSIFCGCSEKFISSCNQLSLKVSCALYFHFYVLFIHKLLADPCREQPTCCEPVIMLRLMSIINSSCVHKLLSEHHHVINLSVYFQFAHWIALSSVHRLCSQECLYNCVCVCVNKGTEEIKKY